MKTAKEKEIQERKDFLLSILHPGDTVYTILRHVSQSGMRRVIGIIIPIVREDGKIEFYSPNYAAGLVTGYSMSKDHDGLVLNGCGMDMGFHLVYNLSQALFGNGYTLKQSWL